MVRVSATESLVSVTGTSVTETDKRDAHFKLKTEFFLKMFGQETRVSLAYLDKRLSAIFRIRNVRVVIFRYT